MTVVIPTSANAAEQTVDAVRYLDMEVSNLVLTSKVNSGKVVYAAPGEQIQGEADCVSYRPTYVAEFTQAIVGFDGIGAQAGIGYGPFSLTAPNEPGVYEVRFRYAQANDLEEAIRCWWGVDQVPPEQATIGLVIVADSENANREINDSNWKEWLHAKYENKEQIAEGVEILPILTSNLVTEEGFWDCTKTTDKWKLKKNTISNKGTWYYNEYNQIVSKKAFQNFDLHVTEVYQRNNNHEENWWSHSRGFGILYYVNDDRNVEFRYFADIGQLSLYIRDNDKVVEHIQPACFPPDTNIVHDISIDKGVIVWQVNGNVIFQKTTTLQQGHLMLTNHNNWVTFEF